MGKFPRVRTAYNRGKEANSAYSLATWGYRALEWAAPAGVLAVVTWAASYRDWIWNDYGMLGVLGIGIAAALLFSLAVFLFGLGARAWKGNASEALPETTDTDAFYSATITQKAPQSLTEDQKAFRIALKQFALNNLPDIANK